jgi:hypothetical protein
LSPSRYSRSKATITIFPRLALQFVLKHREVGGAVGGGHHDLAVDDRGAGADQVGVSSDLLEPVGPVVAAPREDLNVLVGDMELDAAASNLISCSQRAPDGTFSMEDASAGSMKPGKLALTPMAAGFLRWNAIPTPGCGC